MCIRCPGTSGWSWDRTPDPDPCACAPFTAYSLNVVKWSSQGMLRMSCEAMNELFQPTVSGIIEHIGESLSLRPPFTPHTSPDVGIIPPISAWKPPHNHTLE